MHMARASSSVLLLLAGCAQEFEISGPIDVDPAEVTECGFSAVSGSKFSSYDCNPVFSGTDEPWAGSIETSGFLATTILGHPYYQLWYTSRAETDGAWGVGYAVSEDGIRWTPHTANPVIRSEAAWSRSGLSTTQVLWDDEWSRYMLSFQGYNLDQGMFGIGVATSSDGVAWDQHPDNPILDLSVPAGGVSLCWPLSLGQTSIGTTAVLAGRPPGTETCQMYQARVTSPGQWSLSTEVMLPAGPEAYDAGGMASAAIIEVDGLKYLFYVGFSDREFDASGTSWQPAGLHLSLATSEDGITWRKHPSNPFAALSLTSRGEVSSVAAAVVGRRVHVWLTDAYGGEGAVGYFLYEPDILDHP